ncbi:MAG: thioredoxin family protein [Oligoflexia bacterium]|nr:thioredoxin family protein [Oligoflexia bacterium]
MAVFNEQQKKEIAESLAVVKKTVKITCVTRGTDCRYCSLTKEMLSELAVLSPNVDINFYDLVEDQERIKDLKIDKVPAVILHRGNNSNIRFFGVPAGYEFQTLLEDIIILGNNNSPLSLETILEINKIRTPLHIEVIASPDCPYCPAVVGAVHKFAMANVNITSDMIEISEFPDVGKKYEVKGFPHTVINGNHSVTGMLPELELAKKINGFVL